MSGKRSLLWRETRRPSKHLEISHDSLERPALIGCAHPDNAWPTDVWEATQAGDMKVERGPRPGARLGPQADRIKPGRGRLAKKAKGQVDGLRTGPADRLAREGRTRRALDLSDAFADFAR